MQAPSGLKISIPNAHCFAKLQVPYDNHLAMPLQRDDKQSRLYLLSYKAAARRSSTIGLKPPKSRTALTDSL